MKFPKTPILVLVSLMALLAFTTAFAEEEPEKPEFDKMKGIELYKSLCKPCHEEDSDAGEYTPMSLIMEQWDEFYDGVFEEAHKDVVCPKDETRKVTDVFDKDMIKKLRKFCVDHAADSEQPMTCG